MKKIALLSLSLFVCANLNSQSFSKKYIMAYHYCDNTNCANPATHTIQLVESNDGVIWTSMPGFVGYQGSVPDPIIRGDKCYIYTPGKVKRYNRSTDLWETNTAMVQIKDYLGNMVSYVDPSAYVDENGLINLFFLNSTGIIGDPAQCQTPPCIRNFDSAIEVPGSDGQEFQLLDGHRISFTVEGNFGPTDSDVFNDGTNFYQYVSQGTTTLVYNSSTLNGDYLPLTSLPTGNQLTNNAGIPCGMFLAAEDMYYSYGHGNNSGQTEIRLARHNDFTSQPSYNAIITSTSSGLASTFSVASPGICDNTFLLQGIDQHLINFPEINLSPNPVDELLEINHNLNTEFKIKIYDFTGLLIEEVTNHHPSNIKIPTIHYKSGFYFVSFQNDNQSFVKRFVKK